jgi:lysophospholipase L1-like esterase
MAVPAAHADPFTNDSAVVIMGDSFMAGQGGSWQGNPSPNNSSTAYLRGSSVQAAASATYGSTLDDPTLPAGNGTGCHRSQPSEAANSGIPATVTFNIACSGAQTADIIGTTYKGELPQSTQLGIIAGQHNVKTIVVSIGGNDLGFADVVNACVTANLQGSPTCNAAQQAAVSSKLSTAMTGVDNALSSIMRAMTQAGYGRTDYRLILQSYPAPLPPASAMLAPQLNRTSFGCPIYSDDADWTNNWLIPTIDGSLQQEADKLGVEFVDMRDLFRGHELCRINGSGDPVGSGDPTRAGDADFGSSTAEWVHMVTPSNLFYGNWPPYTQEESVHPNAFGHQVMANCIGAVFPQSAGDFSCGSTGGASRLSSKAAPSAFVSLTAAASPLNFGNMPVGSTSPTQPVTLKNLTSSGLTLGYARPNGDFADNWKGCPATLAAGASCTLQLTFSPTATGSRTGILSYVPVESVGGVDVPGPRQTLQLVGNGVPASLTFSGPVQFGGVTVGSGADAYLTVTNQSAAIVHVSSVAIANDRSGSFGVTSDGCSGTALNPNQNCLIDVGFVPATRGSFSAQLLINDDGYPTQQSVAVTGTGVCAGRICP